MRIYWGTRLRGFLKHLNTYLESETFIDCENYYEINSYMNNIKSKIIRLKMLNLFGVFQIIKVNEKKCDCYASFNRFMKVDKPYFIYLENPAALYHYTLGRVNSYLGRKRFNKCLNNPNLKYIVCMSNACEKSFEKVNGILPAKAKIKTIYPLVPRNNNVNEKSIIIKSERECLECLFCVQGIRFVSKGGLEVLSAFEQLKKVGIKIHLTIITKLDELDPSIVERLSKGKDITLYDYNFTYLELVRIYENTNVLLQPSSEDSFGLTVLEAMKSGCAIIASKLYAFPEMVVDNYNGYLLEPKYWFFDQNDIPNPRVWDYRKKTIYSQCESEVLVASIINKITELYENREKLKEFAMNSLKIANTKFDENKICEEWKHVFDEIKLHDSEVQK